MVSELFARIRHVDAARAKSIVTAPAMPLPDLKGGMVGATCSLRFEAH